MRDSIVSGDVFVLKERVDPVGPIWECDAAYGTQMPGVECPRCGPWSMAGSAYPTVNAARIRGVPAWTDEYSVSLEVFRTLQQQVDALGCVSGPVYPGTAFGPISGTCRGDPGPIEWVNPWTLLMREDCFARAVASGVALSGAGADLRCGTAEPVRMIEVEAVPRVRLAARHARGCCTLCGRPDAAFSPETTLDAGTCDADVPLQRIRELPTILIASLRLVAFLQRENASRVAFAGIGFAQ